MSNMSYCRFRNTLNDFQDCLENWDEGGDMSREEILAKEKLLGLAEDLVMAEGRKENYM